MTPAKDTPKDTGKVRTTLIDISNCIGCRACQVACKQWNDRDGEDTEFEVELGFQNPAVLSAKTLHADLVPRALRRATSRGLRTTPS